jgi:hypothetical protein
MKSKENIHGFLFVYREIIIIRETYGDANDLIFTGSKTMDMTLKVKLMKLRLKLPIGNYIVSFI